ncbi:MAG TPA: hypothetical protein VM165_02705 [Planctomycetaceae bacterium]|nr:hypothetical protein [Planctomycetaceae bacterium]
MSFRWFGFEHHSEPLLNRAAFLWRLTKNLLAATALIAASLFAGMAGYRYFEGMTWIDAFANAAMILSGMGPLTPLNTDGGKLFAGCYALYSGLVVVVTLGITLAPVIHRVMHRFHLPDDNDERDDDVTSREPVSK